VVTESRLIDLEVMLKQSFVNSGCSHDNKGRLDSYKMSVSTRANSDIRLVRAKERHHPKKSRTLLCRPDNDICEDINYIGVIAGGIVHDFNNILTGIFGYISLAKEGIDKDHPSAAFLERAKSSTNHAAMIIAGLADLTRDYRPSKKKTYVSRLLEMSVSANIQGICIDVNIDAPKDTIFRVDESQIRRVFDNIIINAVQAMKHNGRLFIGVRKICLAVGNHLLLQPGEYVRIEFCDNGCGISPEIIDKIFNPYFTTKSRGKGLGLASVLSVVNEHYGKIEVESAVGSGTSVRLYIPAK
jgi:two-component system, cell cycle sensor histidine kinase and response regulator CckA